MTWQTVTVTNQTGLHARPASLFINAAAAFRSKITVTKNDRSGSAKSLLGILALGISKGSEITITAEGEDEAEAVAALVQLVESKFGEQ
ncbi:phosphocarrier protein [Hydrogenispora ethanolica]|uniref:Phosphocarrier protein HPr n=1 Tax=Hydrogenispora ethanolica TaxID=1082276 RepID=A0A4R1RXS7_HYDET|nr:HPr family phosphocarrier protein [Hydrogenispora ethanolica]TCL71541.1 phosphocarrier protein [Hydrogenispora ethanolica]